LIFIDSYNSINWVEEMNKNILHRSNLKKLIREEVARYIVECGCKEKSYDVPVFPYEDDAVVMDSPIVKQHLHDRMTNASSAKCPGSYLKVSDEMAADPDRLVMLLNPVMDELGAECPESTAQAIYDIISMIQNY